MHSALVLPLTLVLLAAEHAHAEWNGDRYVFADRTELQQALLQCVGECDRSLFGSGDETYCGCTSCAWRTGTGENCVNTRVENGWKYGPISTWDVSRVTSMVYMFSKAYNFNQNISSWNVGSVTDIKYMFHNAHAFNQDISSWDVGSVTNMKRMFYQARVFDRDISSWNVGSVTDMSYMFYQAYKFDQDISSWDVGSVTTMDYMFVDISAFSQTLCGQAWVESTASKTGMFRNSHGGKISTIACNCPVGSGHTGQGCKTCKAGFYSNENTLTPCKSCVAGRFSATESSSCEACVAGRFSEADESSSCEACVAGRFSEADESSSCEPCIAGNWSLTASSSCFELEAFIKEAIILNSENAALVKQGYKEAGGCTAEG